MKRIKRLKTKQILIIVFIVFLAICFFKYIKKGYIVKYKIEKDNHTFNIVEIYTKNQKKEKDNLYIEIRVGDTKFNYQIYHKFEKRKVIKDIYYYKDDEYVCIYPLFMDNYSVDIKCKHNNYYYNYISIKGKSEELDEFVNNVSSYRYDNYIDDLEEYDEYENIKIYSKNYIDKNSVSITNLDGIYILNYKDYNNKKIFNDEKYTRKISGYSLKYYFTVKYDGSHEFRELYFLDLISGKEKTLKTNNKLSINSYVQGVIDSELYLYDPDNEKQYKVNLSKNKIDEVKNRNKKVSYYNGYSWNYISKAKANNETLFETNLKLEFKDFDIVNKTGNNKSGFYYLFKKLDNKYEVYRASIMNKDIIEYLFDVDNPNSLIYLKDTVYFVNDNSIYYYNQEFGIKKIIEYDELLFNENIKYYVFEI